MHNYLERILNFPQGKLRDSVIHIGRQLYMHTTHFRCTYVVFSSVYQQKMADSNENEGTDEKIVEIQSDDEQNEATQPGSSKLCPVFNLQLSSKNRSKK